MTIVTRSIGLKFERFLIDKFSSLEDNTPNRKVPDFYCSKERFWIEAKAGNILWGPRLKEYQVIGYTEDLNEHVYHFLGFHNFDRAYNRLVQKTERGRQTYLDKNLDFLEIDIVNPQILKRLYLKERRINEKGSINYCTLKKSVFNNIFENREFKRSGKLFLPEGYYDFSREDYSFFEENISGVVFRGILRREGDEGIKSFLRDNKLIF